MSEQSEIEKAKANPATKADAGLALLLAGANYRDIAKTLEYSSAHVARNAIEQVLAHTVTTDSREKMRNIQNLRYERLLRSVMAKATTPNDPDHLAYNARAQAIVDRISRMNGLDAPVQVSITPTQEHLENYTRNLMRKMGIDPDNDEEADILDSADEDNIKELDQ